MNLFPFHALGFRCNPFRALTRSEWLALAVIPDELQEVLEHGFEHLQILGDKGYGKTTRLLVLQANLEARGIRTAYEHLPEGQTRFLTRTRDLEYFFLDEIQRLNPLQRRRLVVQAGAPSIIHRVMKSAVSPALHLVLGSHEDFSSLFARWGLPLQTLTILNSPEHLRQVLLSRLACFSLNDPPLIMLEQPAIELLYAHYGSNYRATIDCLYEIFQAAALEPEQFIQSGRITAQQVRAAISSPAAPE